VAGRPQQTIAKEKPAEGWLNFTLVNFVPPGNYQVQINLHDLVSNTTSEYTSAFQVDAPPPVISTGLELRDLQFSLNEGGPPLDPPVIRAGDTIYMSANLAGMTFLENRIKCKISFQLISPEGESLWIVRIFTY